MYYITILSEYSFLSIAFPHPLSISHSSSNHHILLFSYCRDEIQGLAKDNELLEESNQELNESCRKESQTRAEIEKIFAEAAAAIKQSLTVSRSQPLSLSHPSLCSCIDWFNSFWFPKCLSWLLLKQLWVLWYAMKLMEPPNVNYRHTDFVRNSC